MQKYLLLVSLLIMMCAHKAPPISKDRLNPSLQRVVAIDARHIQFTFSEELDTLSLKVENFQVFNGSDSLKILAVYPSLSSAEIIIVTERQSDKDYKTTGVVFDKAENKGIFKKEFRGTTRPDSIPPRVLGYPRGTNIKSLQLKFSEAIDSASLCYYLIPKKNLLPQWFGLHQCSFIPETVNDSLHFDTTYYLYIKEAMDISGNGLEPFITSFTLDTVYHPIILKGTAMINDTLVRDGMAILKRDIPLGITKISQGEFAFEIRDSLRYTVFLISGDYSGSAEVSAEKKDTISLHKERLNIDSLIN